MENGGLYIQYGCGFCAPQQWKNFDASPSLRIQRTLGAWASPTKFPRNVLYGNIIKGLPVPDNAAAGVYCSHTLEHLSLEDFRIALRNTYKMLKPGGIFRCIVPDLEFMLHEYHRRNKEGDPDAAMQFVGDTLMGSRSRPRGVKEFVRSYFANETHRWMWDYPSLAKALSDAGFRNIRRCAFGDSKDAMFSHVEDSSRFTNSVAVECMK
jgi:SAM-dependent methyltransferase